MATAQAKAAALEGLDFIETEEDVKAVEAATLKIQSTFRGKKIRSKVGGADKGPAESSQTSKEPNASAQADGPQTGAQADRKPEKSAAEESKSELELSRKVAAMQVQDNNSRPAAEAEAAATSSNAPAAGEDEAERAATKIQAGFKGYKTRKELEGKLPAGSASSAEEKGGS